MERESRSLCVRFLNAMAFLFCGVAFGDHEPSTLHQRARDAVSANQKELAARLYSDLWEARMEFVEASSPAKLTDLIADSAVAAIEMEDLAHECDECRTVFVQLSERIEERLNAPNQRMGRVLGDWLSLNKMLGIDDRSVLLFDVLRNSEEGIFLIQSNLFVYGELLAARGRWSDLGEMFADVESAARNMAQSLAVYKSGMRKVAEANPNAPAHSGNVDDTLDQMGVTYAALLAAGREQDANQLAQVLCAASDDSDIRLALAKHALRANQSRQVHIEWCVAARATGSDTSSLERSIQVALHATQPEPNQSVAPE